MTTRRETIARIIDPEAFAASHHGLRKERIAALAKADAILERLSDPALNKGDE